MRDDQFREILRVFGLSWDGYRRVRRGVKKHLQAHMVTLGSRSLKEYCERLERDREAREEGKICAFQALLDRRGRAKLQQFQTGEWWVPGGPRGLQNR